MTEHTEPEELPRRLPPADTPCAVIDAYKKDVDRTLLRERLKLTSQERSERFRMAMRTIFELKRVAAEAKTDMTEDSFGDILSRRPRGQW